MTGLSRRRSRVRVPSLREKSLQMAYCVVRLDARSAPTTQTFLPTGGKERKTRQDAVAVPGFKPIHATFRPTLTVARDYTKRPEVTAGKPARRGDCWRRFSFLCRRPVAADASATKARGERLWAPQMPSPANPKAHRT